MFNRSRYFKAIIHISTVFKVSLRSFFYYGNWHIVILPFYLKSGPLVTGEAIYTRDFLSIFVFLELFVCKSE